MAKVLEKTIVIDNFYGGIAENDLDIYSKPGEASYVQSADLFAEKDVLKAGFSMVDDETVIDLNDPGRNRGYVRVPNSEVVYGVVFEDEGGGQRENNLIRKSSPTTSWSIVATENTADSATEPPLGIWYHKDVSDDDNIYFFNDDQIGISEYDIDNTTLTMDWDSLTTAVWGGNVTATLLFNDRSAGALLHSDGNIYFWKDRYIGPYDGTTKPSAVTPFTLPKEYFIRDALSLGNLILVLAIDPTRGKAAKIFVIDPYSSVGIYTFEDVYDVPIAKALALVELEGRIRVLGVARGDYQIWRWDGGNDFSLEKILRVGKALDEDEELDISPTAVTKKENFVYFGTYWSKTSGFSNGIYAYGRHRKDEPMKIFNAFINDQNDVSNIRHRAVAWLEFTSGNEEEVLHASYYDGANYRMARSNTTRDTTNFRYESVYFRPWRNLRSQCVKATFFHNPLGASDTFDLDWKRDNDTSYTEIDGTVGTQNDVETVLRNNQSGLTNNFLKGYRHKFRVDPGAVEIEAIKLRVRTISQE